MKQVLYLFLLLSFFISCKKEKSYNPDEHIEYTKWYELKKLSNDTLFKVFIPTGFTPNQDGMNDNFSPKVYYKGTFDPGTVYVYHFEVYDWDNSIVFQTNEESKYWNGTHASTPLPMGTYTYKISIFVNNDTYQRAGTVMLIK
jgi:gliding motility-associated-like protein